MSTGKPLDATLLFDDMAAAWEEGMAMLEEALRDTPREGAGEPAVAVATASGSR